MAREGVLVNRKGRFTVYSNDHGDALKRIASRVDKMSARLDTKIDEYNRALLNANKNAMKLEQKVDAISSDLKIVIRELKKR